MSFLVVFQVYTAISTVFKILWAVLRPSEGGSRISGLSVLLFSTYSYNVFRHGGSGRRYFKAV